MIELDPISRGQKLEPEIQLRAKQKITYLQRTGQCIHDNLVPNMHELRIVFAPLKPGMHLV